VNEDQEVVFHDHETYLVSVRGNIFSAEQKIDTQALEIDLLEARHQNNLGELRDLEHSSCKEQRLTGQLREQLTLAGIANIIQW